MQVKWLLIVAGVVLAAASALADTIGLGNWPGLGRQQLIGIVVGVVLALIGLAMRRKTTDVAQAEEGGEAE
jgi:hypothetical protein